MICQGFSKLSTLQKTARTLPIIDQISIFLCLKISKFNEQQLLFNALSLYFIWRNFFYIKCLIEKCNFSTFYLVSKNTKGHFSQKSKLLGFHWTSFWMPHGYPYQEMPFWFKSKLSGSDPSRAELCPYVNNNKQLLSR